MKGKKGFIRVSSLLLGTMLFSILMYGVFNITTTSQAYPPFIKPGTPTPTTPPTLAPTATPTTPPTTPTAPPVAKDKLDVVTIPQEDQIRKKGIMVLCPDTPTQFCPEVFVDPPGIFAKTMDLHAEHKIHFVAPDGRNVDPVSITCQVIQKDVCHIPEVKPLSGRIEATELFNISSEFVCVYRSVKEGVGILEVYFNGIVDPIFIGDHILKVIAVDAEGNRGSEIQDICILGFPVGEGAPSIPGDKDFRFTVRWTPDFSGGILVKYADYLFPFTSCKNAALWQRTAKFYDVPVGFCPDEQIKCPSSEPFCSVIMDP